MNKIFKKIKINETLLAGLVIFVVIIGVLFFYSKAKEKTPISLSPKSISDTASPLESDNSGRYNTWDAETASSVYFDSYEAMEEYFRKLEEKDLAEYNKAIKGTIVEQVQNIAIPSYLDEEQLTQLQQGEILIKEPASEEFPDGISLWAANLEKNKNSFVVGDFNKDGLNDVAHIIGYTGFGSGYFYYLTIFINDHGKLKYLTQKEFGDRVVIKDLRYESGLFVIDMIAQGEGDDFKGYCCPNVPIIVKFKLKDNQLVEL
jgi:hypothetical protein